MCEKSSLEEYFSESHWLNNKHNYTLIMSCDKYFLLQSSLHFNDNKEQISKGNPGYDPPFKIDLSWKEFRTLALNVTPLDHNYQSVKPCCIPRVGCGSNCMCLLSPLPSGV